MSIQTWAKCKVNKPSTRFSCNNDVDDPGRLCAKLSTNRNVPSHDRVPGFPRFRITLRVLAPTSVPQPPRLGPALATAIFKLVYDRHNSQCRSNRGGSDLLTLGKSTQNEDMVDRVRSAFSFRNLVLRSSLASKSSVRAAKHHGVKSRQDFYHLLDFAQSRK